MVESGSAVVSTPSEARAAVEVGDLVLLPRGGAYKIASDTRAATPPIREVIAAHRLSCSPVVSFGAGSMTTRAAAFAFTPADPETRELLRFAPDLVVLEERATEPWLTDVARALGRIVTDHAGSAAVAAAKLGEIIFDRAIRASLGHDCGEHLVLATASLVRGSLAFRWTADELAHRLGYSRAAFYVAFTRAAGTSPMAYLTEVRMREAKRLLRDSERTVEAIAEAVGFGSASSFAAAFRRREGESPKAYRTRTRTRERRTSLG